MGNKESEPLSDEVLAALGAAVIATSHVDHSKQGITIDPGD